MNYLEIKLTDSVCHLDGLLKVSRKMLNTFCSISIWLEAIFSLKRKNGIFLIDNIS